MSTFQEAGIPDLIACIHGLLFGFEVKTPDGGDPSRIQEHTMSLIRAAGGVAVCVRSPEEAVSVVRQRLNMGYNADDMRARFVPVSDLTRLLTSRG